jgi:putative CocE/NonD family hydrolase
MRDGVHLCTNIYAPTNHPEPLPILFMRTPYNNGDGPTAEQVLADPANRKVLVEEGFIFVVQDIRGRNRSEGQFVMMRPPRDDRSGNAIDEGTDAYDTIEWLLKNVPNHNGRVGIFGTSYPGWLTVMAMLDPHPALKAVSPQASPADMFLGDDFHHNGAFRLSYGFEYATMMETGKVVTQFEFDQYDTYEWYLELGPLANVNRKYLNGRVPTWNDFVAHPNYDAFWQRQSVIPYLQRVTVPTLNVAGWWDQEDFYGPLKIYELLEQRDTENKNFLVVGPWNHGGWGRPDGGKLGKIDFGSPTSKYFREEVQTRWFVHHLKGKGDLQQPEALLFETGSNAWRQLPDWPPQESVERRSIYLQGDSTLSFAPPAGNSQPLVRRFVSDPANPVPYRPRPVEPTYSATGSGWSTWLLEDQRFVHQRPDVLSWQSEVLTDELTVSGNVVAQLFAETTGTDGDWIVKLIDVYPEDYDQDVKLRGFQLMVANEVLRGRFRRSFDKPEPVPANEVVQYTIDLHGVNHCFLPGHRIMVQVQSTWFPLIDRNPQTYVENIFLAEAGDFQPATHSVWSSPDKPSHLELPVRLKK